MRVIAHDLFPHVDDTWGESQEDIGDSNFRKAFLLGLMTAKLLQFAASMCGPTDRDSWRIASDAKQMETLLRNSWMWQLNKCCPASGVINTDLRVLKDKLNNKLVTESFVKSFT